jgi:hypothetical protein
MSKSQRMTVKNVIGTVKASAESDCPTQGRAGIMPGCKAKPSEDAAPDTPELSSCNYPCPSSQHMICFSENFKWS